MHETRRDMRITCALCGGCAVFAELYGTTRGKARERHGSMGVEFLSSFPGDNCMSEVVSVDGVQTIHLHRKKQYAGAGFAYTRVDSGYKEA